MYSSFFGIEIAKRALFAQQRAQENVSHNVANANTPGYSRQRPVMEATYTKPWAGMYTAAGAVQAGTGVRVADIVRIRDAFADMQYRDENSSLGQWSVQTDILRQVEAVFNEPSDIGVSSVLTQFWQALEELSKNPEAIEIRETVKERAVTLADTVNHVATKLTEILDDINFRISVKVDEVNTLARQIADLNAQIQQMEITGITASDLRDKRDVLLDDLSKLVNINTYEDENGVFTVNVGGAILVKGSDYEVMSFDGADIKWQVYNTPVNIAKGELKGLLELRDQKVKTYLDSIKTFAQTLAGEFNKIHKSGYDLMGDPGEDFFIYNNSLSGSILSVNQSILNDVKKIAAAQDPDAVPGDNRNALKLADLKYMKLTTLGGTLDEYYGSLIARLGIDSQQSIRMTESQEFMVSQLDEQRKAVSSVSLDEEMSRMIMYQHAYNAAARMITAIDEMLDTIVSRMGITGR
ncbi:flagellar hook-associated protein FlgK [Thermosediminibacter oceani]|uniref:Flagellar hook-associated protein 1 n=1 Tax=Thermosediminibacter oceani (strain ATCC BAA-1034 / DSM 16646 / JW/IW-1228P) TaxID=555079 RepID=D9RYB3_THEOJ|nr:flagellar hook-associated protein FlgK [Thermosediminibacter oceani]ADL08337.1 flagellar hook-associated protein FlgK [Thermosediminibacter oceani DSM 16646]